MARKLLIKLPVLLAAERDAAGKKGEKEK